MKKHIIYIVTILSSITGIGYSHNIDTLLITADSLAATEFYLGAYDKADWYYKAGDDSLWALPEYDHSQWTTVPSKLLIGELDQTEWKGIAWFRKDIKIDSSLIGKFVGLRMIHNGASEIYLNGEKILSFGKFGENVNEEKPHNPSLYPTYFSFDTSYVYTIAVRISNQNTIEHKYLYSKFIGMVGFYISLFDYDTYNKKIIDQNYGLFSIRWAIQGFSLAFTIMFILLYFFYSKKKENLFFALFVFGVFLLFSSASAQDIFKDTFLIVVFAIFLNTVSVTIIFIYLLLFIYQIVYKKTIKLFWFFLTGFLIFNIVILFGSDRINSNPIPLIIGIALVAIENLRVIVVGIRKKIPNIGILVGGVIIFLSILFTEIIVAILNVNIEEILDKILLLIFFSSIPLSMAIYLAKSFGKTNSDLEEQIITIQKMSDKQIEQERHNAELKIQSEINKIENERKTKELEEARQLQLSMLPKELPQLPNLDIAVYMQTATEVGGDYYDFHVSKDNTLTAVIGDATGHGMKAGTVVTITKSMFNNLATENNITESFSKISHVIKEMKFRQLAMCLVMMKIKNNKLTVSSAAMPPVLIYRNSKKEVEELSFEGMPLGAMNNFPYKLRESELRVGDTIFVYSDGLPELVSPTGKMYGYDRTKTEFLTVGEKEPEEIVNHFKKSSAEWVGDNDPDDDVTFVVINVK